MPPRGFLAAFFVAVTHVPDPVEGRRSHVFAAAMSSLRGQVGEHQELPESYPDESISYYRDAVYNFVYQQYGGVA